jgi:hypothetical protein
MVFMKLKNFISKCIIVFTAAAMFIVYNYDFTYAKSKIQQITKNNFLEIKNSQNNSYLIELNCNNWTTDNEIYLQLGKAFKYPCFPIKGVIYEYNSFKQHLYFLNEIPEFTVILFLENFSNFSKTGELITKKILLKEFNSIIKFWDRGGITKNNRKNIIIYYT